MSIDEGISKQTQQEDRGEEPPARSYVHSKAAQDHLRWRVRRCRKWSAAAALAAAGAAVALMEHLAAAAVLLAVAVAIAASTRIGKPPLRKERGQKLELDEATSRDLAVQYGQWKRLGDWMLGLGVVLIANGVLLLVLLFSNESKLPVLLGIVQLGAGLFLCLSSWGTILAYRRLLPRGRR